MMQIEENDGIYSITGHIMFQIRKEQTKMSVEEVLKRAGYNDEEIIAMLSTKANTGLAWKSIIILREQKKDNDIFGQIVSRVIENRIFKSITEVDNFIQAINTIDIPDLGILYNK